MEEFNYCKCTAFQRREYEEALGLQKNAVSRGWWKWPALRQRGLSGGLPKCWPHTPGWIPAMSAIKMHRALLPTRQPSS